MKENVYSILDELEQAVANGDSGHASDVLDDLVDTYDRIKAREQVRKAQALAAMQVVPFDSDAKEALQALVATDAEVNFVRAGLLAGCGGYVRSPDAVDETDVADAIENTRNSEQTYDSKADAVEPVLEDVTVPPSIALGAINHPPEPLPKGSTFSLRPLVTNSGDQAATEVTGTGKSETSISIVPESVPSSVAPASVEEMSFAVTPDVAGEISVTVTVDSANAGDASKSVSFRVLGKVGFIEAAIESLRALESELDTEQPFGRKTKGYLSKFQAAAQKLDQAKQAADGGRVKQSHNQLDAATNVLDAVLNKLESESAAADNGKGTGEKRNDQNRPSAALVATIERQVRGIKGQIDDARRAAI